MSGVGKYPDAQDFPNSTIAEDDLFEASPMYWPLSVDEAKSETNNAMLTNTEDVELLCRTFNHVAVHILKSRPSV